jgi:hypothetical protein
MGIFRVFREKGRRNFSSDKTCWRSEVDSNLLYHFGPLNPGVSVSCKMAKPNREFCTEMPLLSFAISPVSIRCSIDPRSE